MLVEGRLKYHNIIAMFIIITTRRTAGTTENLPADKLHNVTSRLLSNTTRKYIFAEYHPSNTQYLNHLDF